jgi:hypothetical protein
MKTLSSTALAALDAGRFLVRTLVSAYPEDEDPLHIWDGRGDIAVAGTTYTGAAGRFTIQPAASAADLAPRAVDITLSGLDAEVVAMIENTDWHQRPITIDRAVIVPDALTVLHLMREFAGAMDTGLRREQRDGTTTLTIRCESAARELTRAGAHTRSDADQRLRDPADNFFAFSVAAMNTTIDWGRAPERPQRPGGIAGFLDRIF